MLFFPYLEHVSGPLVLPSSAFLILNLVEYRCAGWLLLWFPIGILFFKLLLLCMNVVYILVFCVFSMLSALKIVSCLY